MGVQLSWKQVHVIYSCYKKKTQPTYSILVLKEENSIVFGSFHQKLQELKKKKPKKWNVMHINIKEKFAESRKIHVINMPGSL